MNRCGDLALRSTSFACGAGAQTPQPKVVRIVNPFAAGGNTDLVTRALIDRLTPILKQQFIIENRPGAMTNIASEYVIKAPPDGATLLMGGASNAINMSLFANPPYDTLRDFEPVILCFKGANVLAVHPSLPARNLKELIALARAQPGKLNYATSGLGSSNHIGGRAAEDDGEDRHPAHPVQGQQSGAHRYASAGTCTCCSRACRRCCRTRNRGGCAPSGSARSSARPPCRPCRPSTSPA